MFYSQRCKKKMNNPTRSPKHSRKKDGTPLPFREMMSFGGKFLRNLYEKKGKDHLLFLFVGSIDLHFLFSAKGGEEKRHSTYLFYGSEELPAASLDRFS